MRILIDNNIGIEVAAYWAKSDTEDLELVLPFSENAKVLDAWQAADPAHRSYCYGNGDSDTEPATLIVAWVSRGNGSLVLSDVEPWWDGSMILNAYPLEYLSTELGIDVLKWGAEIDEPVDAGRWEDR